MYKFVFKGKIYKVVFSEFVYNTDADELVSLCSEFYKDNPMYQNYKIPLDLDFNLCYSLYCSGLLHGIVARDFESEKMVACCLWVISNYMLSHKYTFAQEIVWTVKKEFRNTELTDFLLKEIDGFMLSHDVQLASLAVPTKKGSEKLLDKLSSVGYTDIETHVFKKYK